MKRQVLVVCAGLCLAPLSVLAQQTQPANPAQQQIDQAKDAAKKAWDGTKDAAKDMSKKAAEAMQGMDPKQMEEMQKSMMPNENHKLLQQFVGEWDVKTKVWMMPGSPPEESSGTNVCKSEFEGRFVTGNFKGTMMGMPFEGRYVMGYNNNAKQNESVWYDSMSTGIWNSTGHASSDGKVFTMSGTYIEPDGSKKATREVTTIKSPDLYVSEFYEKTGDGPENKMMELTYTRKGTAPAVKPAGTSAEPSK
ncbi:MAG: DUF1579 domain-containing protein [Planctomycetes bacterium]|nr:DUF1579 domain-containing protein [Planctomycetota bacterium]